MRPRSTDEGFRGRAVSSPDLKVKIGVSAYFIYPDPQRAFFGHKTAACFENDLARYLSRSDAIPILIADLEPDRLQDLLQDMDGFVLQGGADVAPETYGHAHLDRDKWPGDPHRDHYELKILEFAINHGKPVLGICRGCQLINVYFGGILYQDLVTEFGTKQSHRDPNLYDQVHHCVRFTPDGLLAQLYPLAGEGDCRVNSVHHQGIRELGKDLKVEAVCPEDGLVEAVAYHDLRHQFILGVQWHPEFSHTLKEHVIPPEPLYNHFLNEVIKRRRRQEPSSA